MTSESELKRRNALFNHARGSVKSKDLRTALGSESYESLSKRQLKLAALLLLALFTAIWYVTPLSTVLSGLVVHTLVPRYLDVQMGQAAVASAGYTRTYDTRAQGRVQRIGADMLASYPQNTQGFEFTFQVIDQPNVINAYAYPGGAIFITSGMLNTMQPSDSEVAAVLAHEIGHVVSRHSITRTLNDHFIRILWAAAVYEDHDDYEESYGEAVGETLVTYAVYLGTMSFSRANEYEADNCGWEMIQRSSYQTKGMISFFEKLLRLESSQRQSDRSQWWSSTHPGTEERIQALKKK
jgi:predicted Zn-dependent protease